ncbi:MAG: hypothetical protein AAFY54_01975 [Cyanobacteria bacterium J06648_10]
MADTLILAGASAEQQALELCTRLASIITAYKAANPTADLKSLAVSQTLNLNTKRATFSVVLPLTQTNSADGGIEFDAEVVIPGS